MGRRARGAGSTSSPPTASRGSSSTASSAGSLDHLPGEKTVYLRWQELEAGVADAGGRQPSAWRWSTCRATPTPTSRASMPAPSSWCARSASRSCSSGDLIQLFEACWDDEQWADAPGGGQAHRLGLRRRLAVHRRPQSKPAARCTRREVQAVIMDHFAEHGLVDRPPAHRRRRRRTAATRTTHPTPATTRLIEGGRLRADRSVGQARPAAGGLQRPDLDRLRRQRGAGEVRRRSSTIVAAAPRRGHRQGAATRSPTSKPLQGWQVDQAARDVIEEAGYGDALLPPHRPLDRPGDARQRRQHGQPGNPRGTRASCRGPASRIEPGIYLPEFGVRSEVNVFVDADRQGPRHRRRAADGGGLHSVM